MTNTPKAGNGVTDAEIAELREKHGITSSGRGIKEFTQIVSFVSEVMALAQSRHVAEGGAVAEVVSKFGDPEAFGEREIKVLADIQKLPYGTKLYATPAAGAGGSVGAEPGEVPIAPAFCPITGRKFWGNIVHPKLGAVATYGGPLDTYTIPHLDDDGEVRCERFDQDAGAWTEGGEPIGWFYDDQQGGEAANVDRLHQLERRLEVRGYELQRESFKAAQLFKVLMGIFNLLNPEAMKLGDGRAMRFINPMANEVLDMLSARIRAIKADVEAIPPAPEQATPRSGQDSGSVHLGGGECGNVQAQGPTDVAFWIARGHTPEQAETEVNYRKNRAGIKAGFAAILSSNSGEVKL